MTFFLLIFGFSICVFEELMVYSVCGTFLQRRFGNKYQDFLAVACFSLILFLINQLHHPLFNVIAAIMTSLILAMLLFTGFFREQLYCCSLACLVIFATEYVGFRLLGGDLSSRSFLSEITITVLIKLTAFFILQVICHSSKNKRVHFTGSRMTTWCFFLYPLSCFILLLGLRYTPIRLASRTAGEGLLVAGLFLLLFSNMLLFFLYDYIVSISEQMREYERNQTRDALTQQHFSILQETNNRYAGFLHDVNNYIQTIQTIQFQGESLHIQRISQSLIAEISDISSETFCSCPVINAILHEKRQEALQKQIDFHIFVEPFFPAPDISDNDLISLLCNLIDNALEAAVQCVDPYVAIQLFVSGAYHVIKIRNPYEHRLIYQHHRFFTSKTDTGRHGFGIQRVEAIAEKYHGMTNCSSDNSEFTAIVLLPVT